jgi:hypothetical protein
MPRRPLARAPESSGGILPQFGCPGSARGPVWNPETSAWKGADSDVIRWDAYAVVPPGRWCLLRLRLTSRIARARALLCATCGSDVGVSRPTAPRPQRAYGERRSDARCRAEQRRAGVRRMPLGWARGRCNSTPASQGRCGRRPIRLVQPVASTRTASRPGTEPFPCV